MADQINTSNFIRDFEGTLSTLDTALNDAVRAVTSLRAFIPQISALAEAVVTIESAVSQARQNIDVGSTPVAAPAPQPALRAIEPTPAPAEAVTSPEPKREEQPATSATGTQCLRLQVTKTSGSLDLKTVDTAVNEYSEIVDLALLDYDGRQATLKIWVSGVVDRDALEQSLTANLLTRIGDGAEVKIEFDQESAAA